jgi:polyphenol oxidase
VHGARVVTVTAPGAWAGEPADAAVTAVRNAPIAVHTADCVPLVLRGEGAVGVAHAGWRGLVAGVVEATVAAMADLGVASGGIAAVIGPCIRPECYEFGESDLAVVAAAYGDVVRGRTSWGTAALDVPAGVRAALALAGVEVVGDEGECTACGDQWYSHRARRDAGRQAGVAWLE